MTFVFDDVSVPSTKYVFGENEPNLSQIGKYTFAFAYDYISLKGGTLCFDNEIIPKDDYHELYYLKQEISSVKIVDLFTKKPHQYRFHSIDYSSKRDWLFKKLAKAIGVTYKNAQQRDQLPTIYQIAVYTDEKTRTAPRIVGFFGNYGIFHLIFFDYSHSIYPNSLN